MNRFIVAMVGALVLGITGIAQAWIVNETVWHESSPEWTRINFDIHNTSTETIIGFGVGISVNCDPGHRYSDSWAVDTEFGGPTYIGDWDSHIVPANEWVAGYFVGPGGNLTNYSEYFGLLWDEAFGNSYDWAYIAIPEYQNPHTATGHIDAGISWVENYGFGYEFAGWDIPYSPAIALFETSGCLVGETDLNNPNPSAVPVPATFLLFGTGLAGLALTRKRKN